MCHFTLQLVADLPAVWFLRPLLLIITNHSWNKVDETPAMYRKISILLKSTRFIHPYVNIHSCWSILYFNSFILLLFCILDPSWVQAKHFLYKLCALSPFNESLTTQTTTLNLSFGTWDVKQKAVSVFCLSSVDREVGIECQEVPGHSKGIGYRQGQSLKNVKSDHLWNAVLLGGQWFLLDACWGAGRVDMEHESFVKRFEKETKEWFCCIHRSVMMQL